MNTTTVIVLAFLAALAYAAAGSIAYEYLEDVWYENADEIGGPPIFGVMFFFAAIWPIFFPAVFLRGLYLALKDKRREADRP